MQAATGLGRQLLIMYCLQLISVVGCSTCVMPSACSARLLPLWVQPVGQEPTCCGCVRPPRHVKPNTRQPQQRNRAEPLCVLLAAGPPVDPWLCACAQLLGRWCPVRRLLRLVRIMAFGMCRQVAGLSWCVQHQAGVPEMSVQAGLGGTSWHCMFSVGLPTFLHAAVHSMVTPRGTHGHAWPPVLSRCSAANPHQQHTALLHQCLKRCCHTACAAGTTPQCMAAWMPRGHTPNPTTPAPLLRQHASSRHTHTHTHSSLTAACYSTRPHSAPAGCCRWSF